jgi:hypothetical protein
MSTIDIKRAWVKFLLPPSEWRDSNAMLFTFYNLELPSTDPEVLNVPFDVYWCVAAMGDLVLLHDGSMAHYTNVASADHEKQTIDLIDRWPNVHSQFMGVAPEVLTAPPGSGRLTGRRLVRFSRKDFERLFVAAITVDTAELAQLLKRTIPPDVSTPEIDIALGRSLLYAGQNKSFGIVAADHLVEGVRAAGRAGRQDIVEQTIPAMFTAVVLARSAHVAAGNQERAGIARQYQEQIAAKYGSALVERIGADDALWIAIAAGNVEDWEGALHWLEQAIRKDPTNYRAFLYRARITAAIDDAESALKLMDAKESEFEQRVRDRVQKRGLYWEKGIMAEQVDGAERDEIRRSRTEAIALRDRLTSRA